MPAAPVPRRLRSAALAVLTSAALLFGALTAQPAAGAAAGPAPAAGDPCLGQCQDILTAGENGHATLAGILLHQTVGTRPAHSADQVDAYDALLHDYSGLTPDQLSSYFDDASFGVPAGQVESTATPRAGVTITRDKATGTPHVKGVTRSDTEFGAGYAAGQDRLWLIDVLRHVGRGQLSSFAGGAAGNRALEQSLWAVAPYTEADLQQQVDRVKASGPRGAQAWQDIQDYVAGLNAFAAADVAANNYPGEYVLTGHGSTIEPFTATDVVAISSVIGAIFGGGGGGEVGNALARLAFRQQLGTEAGDRAYAAWRAEDDPEATPTVHDGSSFPYAASPAAPVGTALPDPGSVTELPHAANGTGTGASSAASGASTPTAAASAAEGVLPADLITAKKGMSNALLVSGAHTASGHPIAVFGPQTGYYAPQILMVQELDGPGLRSRGASFPGLSFYVEIGRGLDYSWSATSANQDITDTFAVDLCEPGGGTPSTASTGYLLDGTCTPFERLTRHNAWQPSTADSTAAGSYDLVTLRSAYGLVTHTGTVGGRPVAYTALRSTYRHEADSVIGFQQFNDPAAITSAAAFQRAAQDIGYTFNWFYADADHTAYYNSGAEPLRAPGTDPDLPVLARPAYLWQGWDRTANTSAVEPPARHAQSTDQDYYVSWNNKQAPGFTSAWGNGAVHRADLLDSRVKALTQRGGVTRTDLVKAMEDAANVDLRAEQVLPELLAVLDSAPVTDPAAAAAVAGLRAWAAGGSHRREASKGAGVYTDAEAIRVLDAWWPLLVEGEFRPGLGDGAWQALTAVAPINETPSGGQLGGTSGGSDIAAGEAHKGSAFQHGWWSYVDKDLRTVLGRSVTGPLDRAYCGGGTLGACRQVLLTTLARAVATPAATTYPADKYCAAGDQLCADSIVHRAMGGITVPRIAWQNRPTYQQVVEFPARRTDDLTNLARGATATASDYQDAIVVSYPPKQAVDGNPGTRWASRTVATAWLNVDLGTVRKVGRVVLDWSDQYATSYRIDVSTDGAAWRTVYATTTDRGGLENRSFTPVDARHVRVVLLARGTDNRYSLNEVGVYGK
ncbi:F5/8 type C domain-containing protein [Kitasatospora sp. SolWspMP-SS2h]|uniref:penicillin acylase family protein n=1 Tax=Kitasatospora sp. SolWspMP-SS2h TaxID=1305729 RepID=UPI000DB9AD20|nr:penicillin acylase family protein [Kitasatospora sp. SolWspMP-SS2h]RAJ45545.1 F5/8 type C domain-containing protein [Kitasatospora sp. SolWspMP-SS2h]